MEDNIFAEVETLITYDVFKKFFRFSLFRGRFHKYSMFFFYIIVSVGFFVTLFTGLFTGFVPEDKTMLTFFGVLTLIMSLVYFYVPKRGYKKAQAHISQPSRYKFAEDKMFVKSGGDLSKGAAEFKYEALDRGYEFDSVLYLFISNRQAFVIEKRDFTGEGLEKLRGILKGKLGKKFKDYRRRK